MTTLATIDLGDQVILHGLSADRVGVDMQRSDSGVAQIMLGEIEGGRYLELEGRFTFALEEQILALSESSTPQLLTHPRFTGNVYIIGTNLDDEWPLADPTPDHDRIGKIQLLEA